MPTQFCIFQAFRRDATIDYLLNFAAKHGLAVFRRHFQHNGQIADHRVIRQVGGAIHQRQQGIQRHRQIRAGGNALVDNFKSVEGRKLLVKREGRVTVCFARRMQDTDFRCIGHHGADELQLCFHRQSITCAGDVAGIGAIAASQHGRDRIAHGRVNDRNACILRCVERGHRRRCCNGADQVIFASHHVRNLCSNRRIGLCVLHVEGHVFSLDEAFRRQSFHKTDAAVIQRSVLGKLNDTDADCFIRQRRGAQKENEGSKECSQFLHHRGIPSFLKSWFQNRWSKIFSGIKKRPSRFRLRRYSRGATQLRF